MEQIIEILDDTESPNFDSGMLHNKLSLKMIILLLKFSFIN